LLTLMAGGFKSVVCRTAELEMAASMFAHSY
jgi:hypothetical protein